LEIRGEYFRKKKMHKYLFAIFVSLSSFCSYAATIKGKITDSKSNAPLTGVVVALSDGKGAISDADGNYEVNGISGGTYEITFSYATYLTYKQTITVKAGEDIVLDMKLMPESTDLKDHTIKSSRITNTEASVINEIKNSSSIASGTSAAQISKTMDRNAAEVVKRIPGVTIQDNRFIVVRGLSDRYNTVWLNDASTPGGEADKKAFSFDIIPAGLIDRVIIYKTPSPDLPGDFAGGMVKVYTTSIADKNQIAVSGQVSSREFSTGTNFNAEPVSKTDWLGYDDGKRNVPAGVPESISSKATKADQTTWSKSFGNDWRTTTQKADPDLRFSLAASTVRTFWGKLKIGNTLGASYTNAYTNFIVERQNWVADAKDFHFLDQRSEHIVNGSAMDNLGVSFGNSKIEFKNLYNQAGNSLVTVRNSVRDTEVNAGDSKAYLIQYESRATYATELTGTHSSKKDTRKYTWTLGYTDLFRNMPDRRIIQYAKGQDDPDSLYKTSGALNILNGGRLYQTLFEKTYSFNQQFTQKVSIKGFSFDVNAGTYAEYKSRAFRTRELGYQLVKKNSTTNRLLYLPYDQIFADSNIDATTRFKVSEITNSYDFYSGGNRLLANYLSLKFAIGKHINVSGGARYEYNEQFLTTHISTDTINLNLKTKFLLPSVNVAYNFTDKSLVRVAYGKTINRPEFREAASTFYYDFDELAGNKGALYPTVATGLGGDTLRVAQIQNYDVRYEFYPSAGEMIHIGAFYKSFKDPIQRVMPYDATSGDNRTFTFINADKAYCYGVELDLRKNMQFLDDLLGVDLLRDFSIVGNLALTKSELTVDSSRIKSQLPKSTLQGQAPYVINAGVYYQGAKTGFAGSVLYNVAGPRMYVVGAAVIGAESLGEMPFKSLDATLSKTFFKHYMVSAGVQNLLNSQVLFVKDVNTDGKFDKNDGMQKSLYPGRYYSLGVKIKF
jgi:TonB-dependent receptor